MQEDFSRYATSDLNRPLTELDRLMDEVHTVNENYRYDW